MRSGPVAICTSVPNCCIIFPKSFPSLQGIKNGIASLLMNARPALSEQLNRYEAQLSEDPEKFPKVAEGDFDRSA